MALLLMEERIMKRHISVLGVVIGAMASACGTGSGATTVQPAPEGYDELQARVFAQPVENVYVAVESATENLGWKLATVDRDAGTFVLQAPTSIWTWGDTITAIVKKQSDTETRVDLTSTTGQMHDWGKNKDNIEALYAAIDKGLKP
ncbi:MAG: hypothetical protein A2289_17135 [Deltaproteobacteria bacterium RIFOXYA12_FULL_58_15]|nr:MAG: hypothetical protein A2289_17135 [Deltaproteobacteria bacterium RIFOXYA12_FULL_58_15]